MKNDFKDTELGRLPKEWEVASIESFARVETGSTPLTSNKLYWNGNIPWMSSGEIHQGTIRHVSKLGMDNSNTSLLPKNTVVIAMNGQGKTRGTAGILGIETTCNQSIVGIVIEKKDVMPAYVYYNLQSRYLELRNLSGAGRSGLNLGLIKSIKIPLPHLPEQQRIAEILSTADEAIQKSDAIIAKAGRLKQGMMQKLLTEGIGHKEFKETEIGRVPIEWEVVKIADICDVKGGKRLPLGENFSPEMTKYPYLRLVDFGENGYFNNYGLKYLGKETFEQIKNYTVTTNEVCISIAGTVGLTALIPPELNGANLTENAAKLCNLKNIDKTFLARVLKSQTSVQQINGLTGKATQPKLAIFRIERICVPLPPLPEQQHIAEILSSIDQKIELEQKRKAKLERIKKGLMNDLLTGRKRVQGG
jgi:type I restriction enzyme S subunit